ncbi:MAG: ABC transporter ATP-binding protein [Candidatus Odinarchaeum yellowstonii]|uniref:ABC transporter ATP-binding protein n=1 Tax=Odinarchaeota yellowstonii (strain LCB_4) TaxID=1841599 RepID=A0AAF0IBK1_ODILC|nr:MAG: ABC transporter ATP-binding protein [Candidatus Odinarchaeum yellowstonii]
MASKRRSVVILEKLTKIFNGKIAVDQNSYEIEEGAIFGLLGPNGAGKTTTIRLLAGVLKPSSGDAEIYGFRLSRDVNAIRSIVGVLPENRALYDRLTAQENLEFYGRLYGLKPPALNERVENLLSFLGLQDVKDTFVGKFSMGMRQKVALARSLIHQPKLLLLDEPTSNLDPVMSAKLKEYIKELSEKLGTTILISSHHLAEIESICSKIAIINNGRVISVGEITDLKKKIWGYREFEVQLLEFNPDFKRIIENVKDIIDVRYSDNKIFYRCVEAERVNPSLIKALVQADAKILSIKESERTLEDLYMKLIRGE